MQLTEAVRFPASESLATFAREERVTEPMRGVWQSGGKAFDEPTGIGQVPMW